MIPALTEMGRSFKGAAAYYLHDKIATPESPGTVDRVAWTETLNLPTDDPDRAWRMMAHTALAQSGLKAVAGVKATGRRLEKPVLAYSLSWHPDEQPTKAEQVIAAKESLLALGLTAHQALIVCHRDEPHPHVHVLVNRVHPMTGKAAPLSKSKLALSQWAQAYEERHGRVFCSARVENNARRAGTAPGRAADNRSRRTTRPAHAAGSARPESAALRAQLAEAFSAQAGQERQGARRRAAEAAALHAERQASGRANADRQRRQAEHPDAAETAVRIKALLASAHPADALAELTRARSTFTRPELERFVARHTIDEAGFIAALRAIDASGAVIRVGRDARKRDRFTTTGHQAVERRMFDLTSSLRGARGQAIPALFKGWSLSGDQEAGLRHVLGPARIAAVQGVAGTGKSTMLNAARQSWEAAGLRVQGLALAAEAAEGLRQGAGIARAATIHSRLYLWEQGRNLPGPKDVIVVDEAGMIGSRMMERLLQFTARSGAKIVLVGDARQLQAIEAGGAFRAIADRIGAVALRTVRRQMTDWQRQATLDLSEGRTDAALARYEAAGMVHGHASDAAARAAVIDAWHRDRIEQPGQTQLVVAFLRRDVAALNALARARLHEDGLLGDDVMLDTASGRAAFAVHDRVYFTRNDARLEVRNGSLGTIEAIHGRKLTMRLDGAKPRRLTVDLDAYAHIAHGYAATIHKSQGATVDRAHLYCSPNLDQHATYVAMTRHRHRLDLHWSRQSIPTRARLAAILSRVAMKDTSFDYAEAQITETDARREAADDLQARIRTRAKAFATRETSPAGRMTNARALLPTDASTLKVARLAMNAVERIRLFRQRQGRLRQWARQLAPAAVVALKLVRTDPLTAHAIRRDHAADTLRQVEAMVARHAVERRIERDARSDLQRAASKAWKGEAIMAEAELADIRYAMFGPAFRQAAAPSNSANNNRSPLPPTTPAPRPV